MLSDIKTVLVRSSSTLAEDAIGVVALFALLIAGLNIPHF